MGTVTDTMPKPGELLTAAEYGGKLFLDGYALESITCQTLEILDEDVFWLNRYGESNGFPDMEVRGHSIDCKGSKTYYGSMFLGFDSYESMKRRRFSYGQIWYVLNDLSVVSWDEADKIKDRKDGGWVVKSVGRTINEFLKEIRNDSSNR